MNHGFKPYADNPDLCVAELADSGDTCNRPREDHDVTARDDTRRMTARIGAALDALDAYVATTGDDEMETAIADLLADLHHLCDAEGIDYAACLARADLHYRAER